MKNLEKHYGKVITKAGVTNDEQLVLHFDDGSKIAIFDSRQSCCERRHMSTDDHAKDLEGGILRSVELKDGPDLNDGDVHETCFLEVSTDKGFITLVNHNEHNGYYGGFSIECKDL